MKRPAAQKVAVLCRAAKCRIVQSTELSIDQAKIFRLKKARTTEMDKAKRRKIDDKQTEIGGEVCYRFSHKWHTVEKM